MLKRKIMDELIKWKANHKKECLLVKGARQIGKTFIIEEFGKQYYKSYIMSGRENRAKHRCTPHLL